MRKMCKVLSMAMILSTIAGTGAISMSVPSLKVDAATTTASQTNVNAIATASGASFKDVNGNNYQVLDETTKTVAFYRVNTNEDKNSTLVIPQTINVTENGTKVKYTVTEIGKKGTDGNYMSLVGDASVQNKFKEIIIPDSVVVIHANAFKNDILEDGGNIQLGKDENFKGLKLKTIETGAFSSAIKNLTVSTYKLDDNGYGTSIANFTNNITFKCYFMSAIWKSGVNGKSLKCAWVPVAPINFGTGMMRDGAGNKFYVGVGTTSNFVMTKSNNKINYPVFELYAYNYGDTLDSNGTTVSNALFKIDNATTKKFLKIQVDYNKKRMKFTPKDSATMTGTQLITGLDNTTDITNTKIVKTEVLKPAYLKFDSVPTRDNALSTLQNFACLRIKYKNGSSVILPNKAGSTPLVTWTATSYQYGELKFGVAPVEANIKLFKGTYSSSVNVLNPKSATTNQTNFTVTKTSDGKRLQVNVITNNPRYYYVVDYATAPGTTYQTLYDGKAAKTKGYDISKVNTIPYSKTRDYVVRVRTYNYPNADGLVDTSYNAAYEGGITVRNPDGKGEAKYFVQRSKASTANIYFFGKRDSGYKISIYKRVNNTRPTLMVDSVAMTADSTFGGCVYKYELTSAANDNVSDILYYYAVIKDSTGKVIDAQGVNANGVSAFSFAPNAGDSTKIKTTQVYRVENKSVMLRPEQTNNWYKNGTYVKMYMTLRNQPESELDFSNSIVQYKYQNGAYANFATGGAIGLVNSVSAFDKMSSSQKNAYTVWHTKDNKVWWVRPVNGSYSAFILKIPLKGAVNKYAYSESVKAITGVCTGIDHKTTVKMNNTELQCATDNVSTGTNGNVLINVNDTEHVTVISADMATSGDNVKSVISDSYKLHGYPDSSSSTYKLSKINVTSDGAGSTLGDAVVTSNDLSKFKSLKLQEGYYDFTVNYQFTNPDKGNPEKYSTAPKKGVVTKHYIFRVVKVAQKCNITASRVNYSVNDELTSTLKITTLDGKRIKMTDAEFTEWKKTHSIKVEIISDVPTVSENGSETETIVATYDMNNTTNNFTPIKSGQYITGFTAIYTPTAAILAENHVFTARATLTEGVSKSVASTTFRIDANGGATD